MRVALSRMGLARWKSEGGPVKADLVLDRKSTLFKPKQI